MKIGRAIPKYIFGLSRNQIWRLEEALHGSGSEPGVSWLSDQGYGMRFARAWYQTFGSLADRGLVERLGLGYQITTNGRQVVEQIFRSYPTLRKRTP